MLVPSLIHCTAVLIFQLWEVQTLSPIPAFPASCACVENLLVNCSSLGLPKAPSHIPATATALDLSHNALHSLAPLASGRMHLRGLQHLWVGNNSLESLSMCLGIQGVVGTRTLTRRNLRCVSWVPKLQSLSVERNQLKCLPRGLGKMKSLKVLQLSHNRISEIGPADLTGCSHLNELHLQYNLINTIHPEAFKDVQKLKVLDVSHNLLVTIPVPAYLSLRNLNVLVDISGNRWRCDCSLKMIRRWLSFDSELGNQTWKMVCFSPSHHAGNDLLYLEELDLTCPPPVYSTPGVRKEMTVDEGMEFILTCSTANQDFLHTRWWTPHGQISDSQRFLHITNTTEHDAGLYVCISGYHEEHVSVFSLHVRKRVNDRRLRREAQIGLVEFNAEDNYNIQRNLPAVRTVQQSQFVLAVCLSVIITFIVAFVLGVILRPFLEKWYKQIRNKRKSTTSPPNSRTSTTAQRPYVNEGYSDTDDQEQQVHEGPRVTFGGVTEIHEQGSVPYYVTVEGSPPGSNTDVAASHKNTDRVSVKNIGVHKEVPLKEENKEMTRTRSTGSINAESSKEMQFEYIPDKEDTTELEERSISPASFLSGERQESQMSYEGKESIEQSVDSPTVSTYDEENELASIDQEAAIPGFITDPFPLKMSESKEESVDELDPDLWNDSGESFSFTEGSTRSSSRVSHVAASIHPLFQKEMSVDEPSDRPSSCNTIESIGGPTEYTVNSEDDKESEISYSENNDLNYAEKRPSASEEYILTEDKKTDTGTRLRQDTITLDPTDIRKTYIRGDSLDELFTEYKEYFPSSNISTAYEEPTQYNVHPVYRTSLKTTNLLGEERSRTSSCSEKDEDKQGNQPRNLEMKSESDRSHVGLFLDDSIFGMIDQTLDPIPQIKQHLHFSQSQSFLPIQALPYPTEKEIIPNRVVKTESKIFSSGDHFFVQIDASLDDMPKIKQFIQFSPSGSPLLYDSTPAAAINQVARPVEVSKTKSLSDTINIFYEGQTTPLPAMSKVQRYVLFRQSEPQTVHEHTPDVQEDSFFGQVPTSFDQVPKLKQYVQFSPSESQLLNDSIHSESIHQVSKKESPSDTISIFYKGQTISLPAMTKVQRYVEFRQFKPQTVHEHTPDIQAHSFLGLIPITFDEMPKVKQYVKFSPFKSKLSTDTIHQYFTTPETVSKTESRSDTISIFYKGQTTALPAMPKVQRYVEFRQFKPQTVHEHTPDIQAHRFFGQIPILFDEVPKVKRHILFSQSTRTSLPYSPSKKKYSLNDEQITHEIKTPLVTSKPQNVGDNFFVQTGTCLDGVPKVKRYIQFTQSKVIPKTHNLSQNFTLNESMQKEGTLVKRNNSLSNYGDPVDEHNFFKQTGVFFDGIPKVGRRIQFTKHQPQLPESQHLPLLKQPVTPALIFDAKSSQSKINFFEVIHVSFVNIPKMNRSLQFTQVEAKPSNQSSPSFSGKIHTSFDKVPKVKRYLQFIKSEPQPSSWPPSTSKITNTVTPVFSTKMQTSRSEEKGSPTIKGDDFFGQTVLAFNGLPKVKRYIQFTQAQPPLLHSLSNRTDKTIDASPELKAKDLTSEDYIKPAAGEHNILGPINASFEIPKVKRYIQFTHAEPHLQPPLLQSLSNNTDKTIQPNSELKAKDLTGEHNMYGKIHTSFDKVPKVKKYLQFIKSEPQPSSWPPSTSKITNTVTPVFSTKMQTSRSEEKGSPTIKEDDFFGQTVLAVNGLPKVKRHIQFTHAEPHLQPPLLHSLFNKTDKTIHACSELKAKDLTGEHNMLGPIGASFEIPKVTRYIQFSQSSTQPSSLSLHRQTARPVLTKPELWRSTTPLLADSKSNTEDTFFKKMDGSELPKVKRYIQFTQQHSTSSKSPNNDGVTDDVAKKAEFGGLDLSRVEIKPPVTKDSFFGQLGTNLNSLLKVNRYIQFTQFEPHPSHQSQFQTGKIIKKEWKTVNSPVDTDAKSSTKYILFDGVFESFDNIPKVKKSLLFKQAKAQNSNLTEVQQNIIPQLVPKIESVRPSSISDKDGLSKKGDNLFGQLGVSLDDVPKIKKYVQFSQSKASAPAQSSLHIKDQSSSLFFKAEIVTPELATKTDSSADYSFKKKHRTFNEVSKVKTYLQFTKSAPQPSAHSPLTSVTTEGVTPAFSTKMQTTRSEDKGSPLNKEDDFFGQTVSSFNEVPKVKRYIQFTQTEPHLQPPLMYSLSNRTDKTIHASSELLIRDLASEDYIQPAAGKHSFLGPIGASFEIPKVRGYIRFSQSQTQTPTEKITKKAPLFTQSEYQQQTAAGNTSSNNADTVFGSLDVSFSNQLPKVKRNVQMQSEPYLSTEEVFKLTTKKNDFFGQTDGVPRLIRYRQHRQSEPHTQSLSPSISSQKWKMMDVESTESRMLKTNVTQENAKDLSQIQEAPSAVKVTTETSRLHQRSPFSLDPDVYKQPAVREVSIQTSSNSLSGDKKYANIQGLSSRTALSTTETETTLESKLSSLGANESAALQTRKPLVLDPALQDVSQYITDKPAASLGKYDAREYLGDSSLARQRQERRRMLFQQKRRAMDGFSLTSESFTSQKSDQ